MDRDMRSIIKPLVKATIQLVIGNFGLAYSHRHIWLTEGKVSEGAHISLSSPSSSTTSSSSSAAATIAVAASSKREP